jgi:hypothetical protein
VFTVQNLQNPLRRARLRRGLTLDEVGARTLLSPRILRVLDEGRFGELPGGVYARSHVRAYASVVELDPDAAMAELSAELPIAEDPVPAMLAIARAGDPAWLIALEDAPAAAAAWVDSLTARLRARVRGRDLLKRTVADGSILLLLQAAVTTLTAWMCGIDVQSLLASAGTALAVTWGIQVSLYLAVASCLRRVRAGVIVKISPIRFPDASFHLHQSRHA